jgi:hypothetical protein
MGIGWGKRGGSVGMVGAVAVVGGKTVVGMVGTVVDGAVTPVPIEIAPGPRCGTKCPFSSNLEKPFAMALGDKNPPVSRSSNAKIRIAAPIWALRFSMFI